MYKNYIYINNLHICTYSLYVGVKCIKPIYIYIYIGVICIKPIYIGVICIKPIYIHINNLHIYTYSLYIGVFFLFTTCPVTYNNTTCFM